MTTIKFDDYLEEEFKADYLIEKNILESAIAQKRMSSDILHR